MTGRRIAIFGELALHLFVPEPPTVKATGEPYVDPSSIACLQLGGAVGIIAQHLAKTTASVTVVAASGDDSEGALARQCIDRCTKSTYHHICSSRRTSVIYLYFRDRVGPVLIVPSGFAPEALASYALAVDADAVFCPFWPGYESLVDQLKCGSRRLYLDFGHASITTQATRIHEWLSRAPSAFYGQFSAATLSYEQRIQLAQAARHQGLHCGVVTAAAEAVVGFDACGIFDVQPPAVDVFCPIGAGDVLTAEILQATASGVEFREAVHRAAVSASLYCSRQLHR